MYMASTWGLADRQRFAESLGASQVHEVQLGSDVLRVGLDARVRLDVDGEDTVRARRTLVQCVLSDDTICFSLK